MRFIKRKMCPRKVYRAPLKSTTMTTMSTPDAYRDLFSGLQALTETSFPRKCATCGRTYESSAEFFEQTQSLQNRSGLKASEDDDGKSIVELYRNCVCGSTLLEFFAERRDTSERGLQRRERFAQLMVMLEKRGIATDVARVELLKVVRGQSSALLQDLVNDEGSGLSN